MNKKLKPTIVENKFCPYCKEQIAYLDYHRELAEQGVYDYDKDLHDRENYDVNETQYRCPDCGEKVDPEDLLDEI